MRLLLAMVMAATACDSGAKTAPPAVGSAVQPPFVSDLPRVVRTPALVSDTVEPVVVVTPQSIMLDGKVIAALSNGAVNASDKEGGAQGMKILPLAKALEALPKTSQPLAIAMARTLPHRLLVEVLFSAKPGFTSFHFLVTDGHVPLAIPLTLPDKSKVATVGQRPRPPAGKGPPGRITVGEKSASAETSLTPDIVLRKIQSAYMAGLKRCYKDALTTDPALTGKVTLTLTVNKSGRAEKAGAKGFNAEIDDCISGMMSRWMFPIPKDADGESVDATISISLQLVPDADTGAAKDPAEPSTGTPSAAAAHEADTADEPKGRYADVLTGERVEGHAEPASGSAAEPAPLLLDPDRMPLGIVVSVTKDAIVVWSISGTEGTPSQPRLTVPLAEATSFKQLNALLAEIVKRRWEGRDRAPDTRAIIVMADSATPAQTIADVFVAVRSTVDGSTPLFPDIQLAVGFE